MADHIHVCPWWIGHLLASPLRRLWHDPEKILGPYVRPGMRVLEPGPGMGFFTLPLARMVGPEGRVTVVDVQQRMLDSLARRARRRGLLDRIDLRLASPHGMGIVDLAGTIDFALAFAVVHEVPDQVAFFTACTDALKPNGRMLMAEPSSHVTGDAFERSLEIARADGLILRDRPVIRSSRTALLERPG